MEIEQSKLRPSSFQINRLKWDLIQANKEEEAYWHQKSRNNWLAVGDSITRFFHGSVKANMTKNSIDKLLDDNWFEQKGEASKGEVASKYFTKLFTSTNSEDFHILFQDFRPKVTEQMNTDLIRSVTKEEIKEAVFSINPTKAPGPDGMTGSFYQAYWDIIGEQVIKEIQGFFEKCIFPSEWNYTHLCLIPKKVNADRMTDLRPISLCSVIYKAVSQILVKRLKPLLPELVSPFQSVFVEERQIVDNIIVAHEVVHSLRTNPPISKEYMAIKTDMSKAFDRVEWSFLSSLLQALGFHQKWIQWVMFCVSTVTFSVLINDKPHGMIFPHRGLRQGDPLSPFLFVLCTEGLSHMLLRAEAESKLTGIRFSLSGPSINHLLFADDTLFMCKADVLECSELKKILYVYEKATGQTINPEKSAISFGALVSDQLKVSLQTSLGI